MLTEPRTILVTGASGHIGGLLARRLIEQGHHVRGLYRSGGPHIADLDMAHHCVDVRDAQAVSKAVAGADLVFHLAARISLAGGDYDRPLTESINVGGTRNVVEACMAHGVRRLVHFSSSHALNRPDDDPPLTEDTPLLGDDEGFPYDRSKAKGERLVREAMTKGLDAVVVAPSGVIGPFDHGPSKTGAQIRALMRGSFAVIPSGGYDFVDVRDVVAAALAAAERGRTGHKYLLSGGYAPIQQVMAHVADACGRGGRILTLPRWLLRLPAPAIEQVCRMFSLEPLASGMMLDTLRGQIDMRSEKARAELGFTPRPLAETIADTVAWFREQSA
ncbi:MAG: NAD-dependent epimerase/dehydratase family protein [Alphaproteobacteria bacterium]|nr:NAD-dependent epimerase/dehydratase family protein [Alphaproteobacteria bacterium]